MYLGYDLMCDAHLHAWLDCKTMYIFKNCEIFGLKDSDACSTRQEFITE